MTACRMSRHSRSLIRGRAGISKGLSVVTPALRLVRRAAKPGVTKPAEEPAEEGNPGGPTQGQTLFYMGEELDSFCREFRRFGGRQGKSAGAFRLPLNRHLNT
jgi:hypothetical protein